MARPGFLFRFEILDRFGQVESAVLGDWLRLNGVAARQLLGGRFAGARPWDDRRWSRLAGVLAADVAAVVAAGLAEWDGEDLVLNGYDHPGEDLYRRQAAGGAEGAAKTNALRRRPPDPPPGGGTTGDPHGRAERDTRQGEPVGTGARETRTGEPSGTPDRESRSRSAVQGSAGQSHAMVEEDARAIPPGGDPSSSSADSVIGPRRDLATGHKPRLRLALAKHGMRANEVGVEEWFRYLRSKVGARSIEEAEAFLAWIAGLAEKQGIPCEHIRHVGGNAPAEWQREYAQRFRRAAAAGASP